MDNQVEKSEPENSCACCFTGHRPQSLPFGFNEQDARCKKLKASMEKQIIQMITEDHVFHFISGMALGVDQWAAEIVLQLREQYPWVTLECALPCETQAAQWLEEQRDRYYSILQQCTKETLLQHPYSRDCMQKRNRYMVDHSSHVLAVWDGRPGGTGSTVRYARNKMRIISILDPNFM